MVVAAGVVVVGIDSVVGDYTFADGVVVVMDCNLDSSFAVTTLDHLEKESLLSH